MSSEHVEVLERLRGVLEHGKMGDKCLIAPDLVTAAIASLSAPQPPAEAQPVAKLVNRKDADGGKTTTFIRPTSLGMDLPLGEYPLHLHPSAPVGVDVASLPALWRLREDNGEEHTEYDKGFETAPDECARMVEDALTQQPAAVDGWRLVVHQSERDTKPAVWATDGDSFVWVADLAAQQGGES